MDIISILLKSRLLLLIFLIVKFCATGIAQTMRRLFFVWNDQHNMEYRHYRIIHGCLIGFDKCTFRQCTLIIALTPAALISQSCLTLSVNVYNWLTNAYVLWKCDKSLNNYDINYLHELLITCIPIIQKFCPVLVPLYKLEVFEEYHTGHENQSATWLTK